MTRRTEREIATEVGRLAAEVAARHGLEIVEVRFHRRAGRPTLRIDLDRPGSPGVGLDDCEAVSRELEPLLDEADLVEGSYDLQVSSPGLDRPIRTDDDIRRNTGRWIVVEAHDRERGRRRLRGILLGQEGGALRIEIARGEVVEVDRASVLVARQEVRFGRKRDPGRP